MKRWHVAATYKVGEKDELILETDIEELGELEDWIEAGPNWKELIIIEVTYNL